MNPQADSGVVRVELEPTRRIGFNGLRALFETLVDNGYEVIGPRVSDGAIILDQLTSVDDLPVGWTDEQGPGRYQLVPRQDRARFGYAVGPHSWKNTLHPARQQVWTIGRDAAGELSVKMHTAEPPRRVFFGVRPCELAAMAKQDRVLRDGPHPDPAYSANRRDNFIVAVDCGDPADTCFCTSMGTGPSSGPGFDLALTELVDRSTSSPDQGPATGSDPVYPDPVYVVRVGSPTGAEVLAAVGSVEATAADRHQAEKVVAGAEARITRRVDTEGIVERIYANLESPLWESVAERCLSCANCTMACPTCFCTNMEDVTDLAGDNTDRWRTWDSCFSTDFSHMGQGPVRESTAARYRQWFVHKLASWHDQFGESGCVGCGRCISWCPVGIDLTEELANMADNRADTGGADE